MTKCKAIQYSDQMSCKLCDLTWDVNDPFPPDCSVNECNSLLISTGLKDRNGTMIYAGSRVRFRIESGRCDPFAFTVEGVVKYHDGNFYIDSNPNRSVFDGNMDDYWSMGVHNICEVV